jgi:phospholipid/cholesterol/gamma-HCH transport system substrate-binding protein
MASRDVKVGLFVLASLAVLGVVVFLIGDERKLFSNHQEVKAAFKDVKGLSRGSPVRMGGVDIGTVDRLGYGGNADDDTIYVQMSIVSSEAVRIRKDSVAEVSDKGLLGDKMIVISVGSETEARLGPGELVKTKETRDIEQIISDLKTTLSGAERVMGHLEKTTSALAEESLHADFKNTVNHLSHITESMTKGEGYVGRLINNKEEADRISATVESFRKSAEELTALLATTRQVVQRVQTGPGFAHGVIYEEGGTQAISQAQRDPRKEELRQRGALRRRERSNGGEPQSGECGPSSDHRGCARREGYVGSVSCGPIGL